MKMRHRRKEIQMSKIAVAGGGAAGMIAAIFAARAGNEVSLYEKNEKLGKKLFITGKGRCNLTNAADMEDLFAAVVSNPKFLYSSFYSFTNEQTVSFFEELGLKTKIERGGRVFPVSDHSSDVIRVLERELRRLGVRIETNAEVKEILLRNNTAAGLHRFHRGRMPFRKSVRTYCNPASSGACADGSKRVVCKRTDGTFSQKY